MLYLTVLIKIMKLPSAFYNLDDSRGGSQQDSLTSGTGSRMDSHGQRKLLLDHLCIPDGSCMLGGAPRIREPLHSASSLPTRTDDHGLLIFCESVNDFVVPLDMV